MGSVRTVATSRARWIAAFALLLLISSVAPVLADSPAESLPPLPTSQEITEAIETESSRSIVPELTDPGAAEAMAHRDLDRSEALELLQAVFEPELQGPAGPFDELHVERFLADNVAVIPAGEQPEAQVTTAGEEPGNDQYEGPTLMDSTVPLRTEAASGKEESVDLGLEHAEGELQPANPLVEVGLPQELGEGIDLPESGVKIELAGAPEERSPSTADDSVAFYPNVAPDTDLAVAPTPTGVETLTQLQSADSPRSETFNLELPAGATLQAAANGGAEVKRDGETLIGVAPPIAIDATGAKVPVNLEVTDDSLTLEVSPEESVQFPILVDPLFQTYEWLAKNNHDGIYFTGSTHEQWYAPGTIGANWLQGHHVYWTWAPLTSGMPGLYVASTGSAKTGDEAALDYTVPRYFTDYSTYGSRPTSFISHMTLSNLVWQTSSGTLSPYLFAGIWDSSNGWVSLLSHEGKEGHSLTDMSYQYQFGNPNGNTNAKVAIVSQHATETPSGSGPRIYVGTATVELSEAANDVPGFGSISGPSQWVNQTAAPIEFTVSDAGLGVYAMTVSDAHSPPHSWKTSYGCIGVGDSACPHTWKSTDAGHPALAYEPSVLPQGTNTLKVVAEDPIGHVSTAANVQVKVDHSAPKITLSGALTEQGTLGMKLPSYKLNVNATDGTTEQPQSGAAKTIVKVDGKVVDEATPGCSTKNCSISREWSLVSSEYSTGQHTVEVSATDAVGLTTTKSLAIELHPAPPPVLTLSDTMTEQATLGATRPRYILKWDASADAESATPVTGPPMFASSFGSEGSDSGQFGHVGDVAIDAEGDLWITDEYNSRVEEFNEAGEFLTEFGSSGAGNGQLSGPASLAIDAKGNIWVADAYNSRIEKFNKAGEYLSKFGSYGSANGQFSNPEGIAIDTKGNIWVTDTYNGRVQKFNENGGFIKVVGSYGSGPGQLGEPTGIDIGPGGNVWVADWQNNRVAEFNEAGQFVRQFGSGGSGQGQFSSPDAIAVDGKGNVWVGDSGNSRIEQFTEKGEYIAQFGSEGSEEGQFSFGYPMGIAANSKGELWITDANNYRVQRWSQSSLQSTIATELSVDGKQVDSTNTSCTNESCSVAEDWTLESPAYSVGSHTVQVKATDGLGRTTTKSLSIEVQRDTTKPTLTAGGELVDAPEGWVEQENYDLNASASDDGYGVTSLAFKMDDEQVTSVTKSCPDGGCEASISKTINMESYSGGAHSAELIATDGAGNTSTRKWTVNVDPEGHVSISEVADTLEAADATSESTVMAATDEVLSAEERADGNDPGLIHQGEQLQSTGTPAPSTVAVNPEEGFTIESPESTVHVEPVNVSKSASQASTQQEVAAVSANTSSNTDTIIRPVYNGLMTFGSIRDVSAPEAYSWQVQMPEGETLKSTGPQSAEVFFEDGTEALLIVVEPAHDAIGTNVPTTLSVESGDVITLTVLHREEPYVYPVVAGTGWEGGYRIDYVARPQDELEIREEEERLAREKYEREVREAEELGQPAPEYVPDEKTQMAWAGTSEVEAPALVSSAGGPRYEFARMSDCQIHECNLAAWRVWLKESFKWNGHKGKVGGEAWHDSDTYKNCDDYRAIWPYSISVNGCDWIGNHAFYGYGEHFCAQSRYHINRPWASDYAAMTYHNYGDGYAGAHWNDQC